MEQVIDQKTGQQTRTRVLLAVGLLLAGGLGLATALIPTGQTLPDKVTCDPVVAFATEPTVDQMKSVTRTTKRFAHNVRLSKTITNQAALKQAAEFRKRRLLALFSSDPAAARQQILRVPEREKLNAVSRNCIEAEVTVAGVFTMAHGEDFANHQEYHQHFVVAGQKRYELFGLADVAEPEPGSTVQISGFEVDGHILVAASNPGNPEPTFAITSVPPPIMLPVATQRQLLVLMGDFNNVDMRTPDYPTVQTVFPQIADYYEENSYDRVTFNTTSFDWFEMNLARGSTCDFYGVARELIRLADPQVDFAQFNFADLAILAPFPLFPQETSSQTCHWGGMSSVTPQTFTTDEGNVRMTVVWIKTPASLDDIEAVLDHELGHNIAGSGHANWTRCPDGESWKNSTTCNVNFPNGYPEWGHWEYGDPYDVMGAWYYPFNNYQGRSYGIGHFNAARKAVAGWIPMQEIVTINSGDPGQTVTLVPLERNVPGVKLLKIQHTATDYMTVQFRQPLMANGAPTYDDVFSSTFPAIFQGATVHTAAGSPTYLMDTTPLPSNDPADVVVRVGQIFSDPSTGAAIRVDAQTSDALTVTVTPPAIDFWAPGSPVYVNDGPGDDIDTTDITTSLAANWAAVTDIGFGVDHYEYTVNWPSGELIPPTSVGLNTSITLTGLNLQPGITYLVGVRAIDQYGNIGYFRFSDGLTINTIRTPDVALTTGAQPAAPDCVYDGLSWEDLAYSNQHDVISAVWCESIDPVSYYQYAIGTTFGGTNVVPFTRAPENFWFSHTGLNLVEGQRYYVTVRGVGSNGVAGPSAKSDGLVIDLTAPTPPLFINDGFGPDEDTTASVTQLIGNWGIVTDPSKVQYHVGLGTAPGQVDVHSFSLFNVTSATWADLPLVNGKKYYLTLRSADLAGNLGAIISSDGITVDTSFDAIPPVVAITVPTDGATVSGTFLLTASATDDHRVEGVRFYLDGQAFGSEVQSPPYIMLWNTSAGVPGQHTVHAVARDAQNQTTSAIVNVTVDNPTGRDSEGPTLLLISPGWDSVVSGMVNLWAFATDNIGVANVQYYLSGQAIGPAVNQWPYSWNWDSTSVMDGTYSIMAQAHDAAGNQGVSTSVNFVVHNGNPPDYRAPRIVTDLRRQ